MVNYTPKVLLSIAGSDNSAGAGIQADIKTCISLKAYCLCCLTTVTSQNSKKVHKLIKLPNEFLESQIKTVINEYPIDCVKVGLLNNINQAKIISKLLKKKKIPIVVDPIYQSTTKKVFNKINSYKAIYKIIAKLNPVFTPNLNEAKILLNINNNLKINPELLVKDFLNLYKSNVIITNSGSSENTCEDYFIDEKKNIKKYSIKKIKSNNTHGSGCTFSTSLAIFLSRGFSFSKSIQLSKKYTLSCIRNAPEFNLNYGPLGHSL